MNAAAHDKAITLVGGKGGVGKTTVAAALAVASARRKLKTLLVSTDPAHSLGDVLDRKIGSRPTTIENCLDAIEIDAEALAADHVDGVARALKEYAHPDTWPDIDRQMDLARDAPGTVEAALVEFLSGLLQRAGADYDRIILDTAPGGHTLRLLKLPESMGQWATGLLESHRRHARFSRELDHTPEIERRNRRIAERLQQRQASLHRLRNLLTDPERTGALIVVSPERLPIHESTRLIRQMRRTGIAIDGLIVNGLFPEEDSDFMRRRRRQQSVWLDRIEREFPELPIRTLELLAESPAGIEALARLEIGA